MLRRKIAESLTIRIFLITAAILLFAVGATFALIAWATPLTYTAVVNEDLTRLTKNLAEALSNTDLKDSGPLLDAFVRSAGADVTLLDADGQAVNTGSKLALSPRSVADSAETTRDDTDAEETGVTWVTDIGGEQEVAFTFSEQDTIACEVQLADQTERCILYVTPRVKAENLAVRALLQMAPWLVLVLTAVSLVCALVYSRCITRPIVRLSGIAGRMAELDFGWVCREKRRDEIGALGRSLDELSRRVSAALTELEGANRALRGEVEQERELDRQRTAFFSAASHELKTPVTILKGQLSGMLEGVDVYRDRDKYLLRSLQVTGRMENLIREMLEISRMEAGATAVRSETVELAELLRRQLALYEELFRQRGQRLTAALTPGAAVSGDPALLGRAAGNLLSNAALYSAEGAEIRVWCGLFEGQPALTVENTGAHISETAQPHLFEAFYRGECSRSRATGGSGLGLYLVQMISARHGASCSIENTAEGVRAVIRFAGGVEL